MTALAAEFFTLDEVNRLKIIQDVIDRRLTTQMAAQRLGISDRQCRRLLARYREDGPLGMTSRVSKSLTVQYDKVLYLIEDNEFSRRAIGKYIDVWHYPDGHKELRLNGVSIPYSTYDKLSEIDQGAIVDNKRLGRALEMAQLVQAERDNNRSQSVPSGDGPSRRRKAPTTKKSQRSLDQDDMFNALVKLQTRAEEIFGECNQK